MKKISLVLLALSAIIFYSCDKDDDDLRHTDNTLVESTFNQMYSNASRIEWEKKGTYWVVDFHKDNFEKEAWFAQDGSWVFTKTDYQYNLLPQAVKDAFAAGQYATWRIDDVDMVERKNLETVYVIEVEQGNSERDLYFSPQGTLFKDVPSSDADNKYLNIE